MWQCPLINKSWAALRHKSHRQSSTIAPWPPHSRFGRRLSSMGCPTDRSLAYQKSLLLAPTQIKTFRLRVSSSKTSPRASSSKKKRSRRSKPGIDLPLSKQVAGSGPTSANKNVRNSKKLNESRVSQLFQQKSLSWSTSPTRNPPSSISWLRRDTHII